MKNEEGGGNQQKNRDDFKKLFKSLVLPGSYVSHYQDFHLSRIIYTAL